MTIKSEYPTLTLVDAGFCPPPLWHRWIPLYVESRGSERHCLPPLLCAGRWHGPARGPPSPPGAERQHSGLASLAEHCILHHLAGRKWTVHWWWQLFFSWGTEYLMCVWVRASKVSPGWKSEFMFLSLLQDAWSDSGISKYFFLQNGPHQNVHTDYSLELLGYFMELQLTYDCNVKHY